MTDRKSRIAASGRRRKSRVQSARRGGYRSSLYSAPRVETLRAFIDAPGDSATGMRPGVKFGVAGYLHRLGPVLPGNVDHAIDMTLLLAVQARIIAVARVRIATPSGSVHFRSSIVLGAARFSRDGYCGTAAGYGPAGRAAWCVPFRINWRSCDILISPPSLTACQAASNHLPAIVERSFAEIPPNNHVICTQLSRN
jgi:hypothetical protein